MQNKFRLGLFLKTISSALFIKIILPIFIFGGFIYIIISAFSSVTNMLAILTLLTIMFLFYKGIERIAPNGIDFEEICKKYNKG